MFEKFKEELGGNELINGHMSELQVRLHNPRLFYFYAFRPSPLVSLPLSCVLVLSNTHKLCALVGKFAGAEPHSLDRALLARANPSRRQADRPARGRGTHVMLCSLNAALNLLILLIVLICHLLVALLKPSFHSAGGAEAQ